MLVESYGRRQFLHRRTQQVSQLSSPALTRRRFFGLTALAAIATAFGIKAKPDAPSDFVLQWYGVDGNGQYVVGVCWRDQLMTIGPVDPTAEAFRNLPFKCTS